MLSRAPFVLSVLLALSIVVPQAAGAAPRSIPGHVIVKYKAGAKGAERAAARASANARFLRDLAIIHGELLEVADRDVEVAIEKLRRHPHVEYAEPDWEVHALTVPNDPRFPEMYGLRNTGQTGGTAGADIKAAQAWDLFTGDPNLKIGVIDTGVDYNHPDLTANVWTNPGEIPNNSIDDDGNGYVDDIHGFDFSNNDGDPFDDNGHGTHCSGTIAAVGNNNVGTVGVVWTGKIVGIKFLSAGGSGSTSGAIQAVQYALAVGVRLTSNSWGGGGFSQALLDAINAAGAAGQLFVAAAGNSSANTDTSPHYPSSYSTPFVIAVAATDHHDNLASFSNFGATTVDLAAPGVNILSTMPGNSYGTLSGTSMATPHVAGAVALAWGRYPALTPMQVKDLLLIGADPKASLTGKVLTGARLNAFMTIAEPDDVAPGAVSDLATSDAGSNTMRLSWTATGDDGNVGRAVQYEIRYSTSPITGENFGAATQVAGPDPQTAGSAETFEIGGLAHSTPYYFALRARDEFNNAGPVSNVAPGTTLGPPEVAYTPGSFSAELLSGALETQTLTLTNVAGDGTLDFTIPQPEFVFGVPVIQPYVPLAKDETDQRVGSPVVDGRGGPDAFGYRWLDSDEPGGPAFAWEDITGTGNQLSLTGDDATSAPVDMGITFPFYGANFTQARVSTNGFLSFTDPSSEYGNQPLPNSGGPANLVAPFWDDLNFGTALRVYTQSDGARFIVSWVGVPHYGTGGPYTFQAILHPTGEIRFQYLSMASPINSATTGIQNATKDVGLTVAFNTSYLHDNLAVRILPLPEWLSVTPTSGRLHAGESVDLQVRFNAVGLLGGNYDASLRVNTNDPDEASLALPAHLHVIGAPDLATSPASLGYGTVFVGASPTLNLTVSNPGTDDLTVTGIATGDPSLTVDATSFTLAPKAVRNVVVTWHPTAVGTLASEVAIESNDPDQPLRSVPVTGEAVPAPSFTVNPEFFDVSLLSNTATTQPLTIQNIGGSPYVFTAEAINLTPTGSVVVKGDADNVFIDKGQPDVLAGPTPTRAGGPDVFGYTYADSDEPGGPTFSWQDISAIGTPIVMSGDDANAGPYPIGFSFPYYGTTFTTFRACTNGWISFTSNRTNFSNTALPNSGSTIPENLLAMFWDDLHFDTGAGKCFYWSDGTKLIVQYQGVRRIGESATTQPNSFQAVLYADGTILYQYLSILAATKNSCTIGMQNGAKNDGLQVVFNAAYIKNNLAIRFRPPSRFLTVVPGSGSIPAGGSAVLNVGFNAGGLFGGDYNGLVRLRGNDPVQPQRDLPATLHVTGVPDVAANPGSIDFGETFIGFPRVRQLTVANNGTDVLSVTNVTLDDTQYGVDQTVFSVPPLGSAVLTVTYGPTSAGAAPATLTVHSNDPDTPQLEVGLAGVGLVPPDVAAVPTSLSATLGIPADETQTLRVRNDGGSDLDFVVGTLTTAASVAVYEPLELDKEEADPRTGILGSGGPDAFGYRWRDSDEPGGPQFDWVDITGIGTPVVFGGTGDDQTVTGIPIGFDFPFYGSEFSTVSVCSNGWLSFTHTGTDRANQPLPNTGAPANLLAAFWDDLDPENVPRVFVYRDGTRFICSYVAVPRFLSGGPYTFQVILYPSGRIRYQYLDMQGTRLNEATIGIQNAAKNDGLTVVHNAAYVHDNLAVELTVTPEYLTVNPSSGTIPAGGFLDLDVTFDTEGLFGGTYNGALRIASNDPDEGVLEVPTTLVATGTPDIETTPASVDFGPVFIGLTADRTVTVRNVGSDVLNITGHSIAGAGFSLVGGTFPITLGQNGAAALTVRFAPGLPAGAVAGTLTLSSNDPDEASFVVPLAGTSVIPPDVETDPVALRAALATTLGPTAITRTKTLMLRNTGGSDLIWTAEALTQLLAAIPAGVENLDKEEKGSPGEPVADAHGGPDGYGYRWADSNDPLTPPFEWIDITGVGTPIDFTGDDQNRGPFTLPFSFPFYGNMFTSFRVCTNGWLSFTSTATSFGNTALPTGGTTLPNNLIAAFWDDLTFSSAGDAYYHHDGEKMIVSFVAVPRLGTGGGPYTFQILLYPSGTIDLQYLDMQGDRLDEATIGIQNAGRDVGLTVANNTDYVQNGLRIRIARGTQWLAVSPASGVLAAGAATPLQVAFNATGLADGDYAGLVRIASNDPDEASLGVPADLHVGVMSATFDIDPNSLNRSTSGRWVNGIIELGDGHEVGNIRTASVLVEGTVPVAGGAPISVGDVDRDGVEDVTHKHARAELLAVLPSGESVPVTVIGEEEDVTWFTGTDHVRVLKPAVSTATGKTQGESEVGGEVVQLVWQDPEGFTATSYELWFSADDGESWIPVASGITAHEFDWSVPAVTTDVARLDLVAWDALGPMGSWLSEPFTITSAIVDADAETPREFGMRLIGANPARARTALQLAVAERSEVGVRVYDVQGALVRTLAAGPYDPGYYSLPWDGRDDGSRRVAPGIYFARMSAAGREWTTRVVFIE